MKVTPLGAAGTVTGSRFLLETAKTTVLLDCGLFQGLKNLRLRNWRPFPIPVRGVDAVVLTHAHLDHSGYLPVLVREGFRGPIFVTPPTADLLPILLEDAGRLQEEDAGWANRKGFSKHDPARALFTEADARAVVPRLHPQPFGEAWEIEGLTFRYHRAGHIIGAASVEVRSEEGETFLFSGDLGRAEDRLLPAPVSRPSADFVVMEATYGDRTHPDSTPEEGLAAALRPTLQRGGVAMVATFAVGRAQTLALLVHRLIEAGEIPEVPVYLNSPMAIRATQVHLDHIEELRPEMEEVRAAMDRLVATATVDESRELNRARGPLIVLAGAGMLAGGRILHHLKAFGGSPDNALLLPGYQAEGTRGRRLRSGDRRIRIHGQWVEVLAQIHVLDQLSGHADEEELANWISAGPEPTRGVLLVHAEPAPADAFRVELGARTGWKVEVAEEGRDYP